MDLPAVLQSLIWTEVGRTFVPFRFGGEADNILFHANEEQKQEFLVPTIEGERLSCFAITEPGAGSDAANIRLARPPRRRRLGPRRSNTSKKLCCVCVAGSVSCAELRCGDGHRRRPAEEPGSGRRGYGGDGSGRGGGAYRVPRKCRCSGR